MYKCTFSIKNFDIYIFLETKTKYPSGKQYYLYKLIIFHLYQLLK